MVECLIREDRGAVFCQTENPISLRLSLKSALSRSNAQKGVGRSLTAKPAAHILLNGVK